MSWSIINWRDMHACSFHPLCEGRKGRKRRVF